MLLSGEMRRRSVQERIRSGEVTRADVVRRLAELAYGKANDCVRLALEPEPRLVDRLKVLEQLAGMTGEERQTMDGFLQALQGGGEGP